MKIAFDQAEPLDSAVQDLVESLCFAEAHRDGSGLESADLCWSAIALLEPGPAELVIAMGRDLLVEFADASWGAAPDDEDLTDFRMELVNAIGGRYLAILSPDARIRLGMPTAGEGRIAAGSSVLQAARYDVDGELLLVVVRRTSEDRSSGDEHATEA